MQHMTLSEAVDRIPLINGKSVTPQTLWRWCVRGVRGQKLRSRFIGGRRVVSEDDLDAFLAVEEQRLD